MFNSLKPRAKNQVPLCPKKMKIEIHEHRCTFSVYESFLRALQNDISFIHSFIKDLRIHLLRALKLSKALLLLMLFFVNHSSNGNTPRNFIIGSTDISQLTFQVALTCYSEITANCNSDITEKRLQLRYN